METLYISLIVLLFFLAIADLVVGVSNDAVNFLNSAIGSKAVPMRTILIVAGLGILAGAVFSSGLMEVARKGIFNPELFFFDEIIIIFLAVLITDILLLDFFNSLGIPTSTTVSVVFELLGAAVVISLLKLYETGEGFASLEQFINVQKASEISLGILISVFVAFIVGAAVQFVSRLVFSFDYHRKLKYIGGLYGGISLSAITYFILLKGTNSITFLDQNIIEQVLENKIWILSLSFVFWTLMSQLLIQVFKCHILKVIVVIGTFALALAFAGNDLVNFIGVSIAAWQSFLLWQEAFLASGVLPSEFLMDGLSGEVQTPVFLLVTAGAIMVVTLWFSSKAQYVVQTGVNLGRQGEGQERFQPNALSRTVVRYSVFVGQTFSQVLSEPIQDKINSRFSYPEKAFEYKKGVAKPAFDLLRASVNLVLASILITLATSYTLPLSTTYVTFMVAMGTSFGDRAWGRESAVYRVAGVFNVIGSWIATAAIAFTAAGLLSLVIWFGSYYAIGVLLLIALFSIVRSAIRHSKRAKYEREHKKFNKTDIITINEMTKESSENIVKIISGVNDLLLDVVNNLGYHDLSRLKKSLKTQEELELTIDELKDNIFYYIKSLEDTNVEASKFYVLTLDYLQDMVQSLAYITRSSHTHVSNNHKNLKFSQIRDLKSVQRDLDEVYGELVKAFQSSEFDSIEQLITDEKKVLDKISDLLQKQIDRIRDTENSPKNSKLYFGILLETKNLTKTSIALLELFKEYYEEARQEF
ncbi:inorganic phosphate transporter [Psychroflexus montanilacus]|uniref:inorganic phosphate transporter n=1 Tax=Psychroflexus montanilacus TaxID=2873598 RepID=UPI001CCB9B86|nr:inorganic phosphate transporter [Psychroflexus montanilacus]MBZ9652550.1 inorganic phosphate transporter [Psychroflexus montanilacus]